jgi:hypothetical protein
MDHPYPDDRPGIASIWITATRDDRVLGRAELALFVTTLGVSRPGVKAEVTSRYGVPAIRLHGEREQREAGRLALGKAFRAFGFKWIVTKTDFAWLKANGYRL